MRIVEDAKRSCGFVVPDDQKSNRTNPALYASSDDSYQEIEIQEYTLLDRIATILAYAGNKIDKDNLKDSVLNVIEGLCQNYREKVTLSSDNELSGDARQEEEQEEEEEVAQEENKEEEEKAQN